MKNHQDRVGEKPAFVERANEDIYFAAKEHDLIERIKAEFHKVEAAGRTPVCGPRNESFQNCSKRDRMPSEPAIA